MGIDTGEDYHAAMKKKLLAYREGRHSVMTLSSYGAIAGVHDEIHIQPIEPVEPVGRLGGGDAFSAGYLHAQLEDCHCPSLLKWSTTVARLKYTIPGDLPLIDRYEVEAILASGSQTGTGLRDRESVISSVSLACHANKVCYSAGSIAEWARGMFLLETI